LAEPVRTPRLGAQGMAGMTDVSDIVRADFYAKNGYPHEAWRLLRRDSPVRRFELDGYDPFWAITAYKDIVLVSRQPRLFRNEPRLVFSSKRFPVRRPEEVARSLLNMDPPDHGKYRALVNRRFTPHALSFLRPHIEELSAKIVTAAARELIAGVVEVGECDFVTEVAARLPLAVILDLLGVPRGDWETIFEWTNQAIAPGEPEYRRGSTVLETAERARLALFDYFGRYVAERRREPREDLVSVLATSRIDGDPVGDFEILSYCFLLAVAGNETTRNATSGGVLALIEHPGELERLREDPGCLASAVEEVLRWTSPVIHFCRTATEDTELRGQKIRRGDLLILFYPSANRDEEVFPEPFRFDVGRSPNEHLAFGIGEHFCLGANLARLELSAILAEVVRRLDTLELAGSIERVRSNFVGGIKRMPVRFRMRPVI
jgi:cholest-4-en-3-one 26-monooxygenase